MSQHTPNAPAPAAAARTPSNISLEKPPAPPRPATATPPRPAATTVRVVHDARRMRPPARGVRAVVGLLLAAAGALLAALPPITWHWLLVELPVNLGGKPLVQAAIFGTAQPLVIQSVVSAALVLVGLLIARVHVVWFLVTAAVAFSALHCLNLLLDMRYEWQPLIVPAILLAFIIHLLAGARAPNLKGLFGFVLMVAACTGAANNWFDWHNYAASLENWPSVRAFFADWGAEAAWAAVLILTAVAVTLSRGPTVHVFNAALLLALAWYCIDQGAITTRTYEFANGVTKTIEAQGWRYVPIWRWALAGELVLLSVILLHLALGMGAITLGVAVVWMIVALNVDQRVTRLLVSRVVWSHVEPQFVDSPGTGAARPGGDPSRASPSRPSVMQNMGLPLEGAAPGTHASIEPHRSPEEWRADVIGVTVSTTWSILTAILTGLIAASGLRMLVATDAARQALEQTTVARTREGPRAVTHTYAYADSFSGVRHWFLLLTWLGLGALLVVLWHGAPRSPDQKWLAWFASWGTVHRSAAMIAIAWITLALAASWSLREHARYLPWLYCAAISALIGTLLSLGGIALLIRFAKFPELPVWWYVVIAAGQSALLWILLMHRNLGGRRFEEPVALV